MKNKYSAIQFSPQEMYHLQGSTAGKKYKLRGNGDERDV